MTELLDPVDQLLRVCACIELDEDARARLAPAAERVTDWQRLVEAAEDHGLAPLVRRHARSAGVALPQPAARQLDALVVRHRLAARVLTHALCEIVDLLDDAGIENVVLKGAVLAHALYPEPELRPMRDLDILVAPGQAWQAQLRLQGLGFDSPMASSRARAHHHLPIATCQRDGFQVSVEIHDDAFSRDWPGRLTLRTMSGPARDVAADGRTLRSFGHVDMLRHLSAHALEPRADTRLIGVVDLVEYAARYVHEIDWDNVRREHAQVVNTISLMHYVRPLPAALDALRPPRSAPEPPGAGRGFVPLGAQRLSGDSARRLWRTLLYPPEWWLRAYYGVPPRHSVFPTRWGRHLCRVAYWCARRLSATRTQDN